MLTDLKKTLLFQFLLVVFFFLLGFLLYWPSLSGEFQFDDIHFILQNPGVRCLDRLDLLWNFLPQPTRFVGLYTFALNYHMHQSQPWGYHLTNLLIHVMNAFFVYHLVILICGHFHQDEGDCPERKMAILTALLFLLHPLQTQAISYISQRFACLATFFYFSALISYLCARKAKTLKAVIFYMFSFIVLSLLGMLTKEVVITLPFMVLGIEGLAGIKPVQSFSRRQVLTGGMVLLTLLCFIPMMFAFKISALLLTPKPSASHAGDTITFGKYLLTQMRVFWTFVRLFFLPVHQNVDYDYALSASLFKPAQTFYSALGLCLYFRLIWIFRREKMLWSFSMLWVLIAFSANLVPRRHIIFEHKFYLLSFGFCWFAVLCLSHVIKKRRVFILVFCGYLVLLGLLTFKRNFVWRTEIALWSDTVKKSPAKSRPYVNLGNAYFKRGDVSRALENYHKALQNNPRHIPAYLNRGVIYEKLKNFKAALADYDKIIAINPRYGKAYGYRGYVWNLQGSQTKALQDYNTAIELDSSLKQVYTNRGIIFKRLGQYDKALNDYNKAVSLDPDLVQALGNRGNVYRLQKQYALALADLEQAINLDPQSPLLYMNRALVYQEKQQYHRALSDVLTAQKMGYKPSGQQVEFLRKKILENEVPSL
ncbi:MAG: tetratricopeptide repeat protein [Candidatus Omnitrophica bacterium]|nr:tetratricopeptide repeat protein [Candidatus Omnitrophota bacterium]